MFKKGALQTFFLIWGHSRVVSDMPNSSPFVRLNCARQKTDRDTRKPAARDTINYIIV